MGGRSRVSAGPACGEPEYKVERLSRGGSWEAPAVNNGAHPPPRDLHLPCRDALPTLDPHVVWV